MNHMDVAFLLGVAAGVCFTLAAVGGLLLWALPKGPVRFK